MGTRNHGRTRTEIVSAVNKISLGLLTPHNNAASELTFSKGNNIAPEHFIISHACFDDNPCPLYTISVCHVLLNLPSLFPDIPCITSCAKEPLPRILGICFRPPAAIVPMKPSNAFVLICSKNMLKRDMESINYANVGEL